MKKRLQALSSYLLPVRSLNPRVQFAGGEFTYIDIGGVDRGRREVIGKRVLRAEDAPSRARHLVQVGDVLVSTVRPNLNTVALVGDDHNGAIASTGFCVLRADPGLLDHRFLFHWVSTQAVVERLAKFATGATYPAVTDSIIKSLEVKLPSLAEQRQFASILDRAEELRCKREKAIRLANDLIRATFVEIFGDPVTNPRAWDDTARLESVAEVISGITKGRKLDTVSTREVPYLSVSNVQDRYLDLSFVKRIAATEAEIHRYRLQENDLLLTEGGDPDKLGRGTLWRGEISECIHQNHVFRVRLTSPRLHPVYLNWLVGSPRGKQYFLAAAKQTTGIASINMRQLKSFPLLIPPLDIQLHFVSIVEKVSRMIERQQSALQGIEQAIRGLGSKLLLD